MLETLKNNVDKLINFYAGDKSSQSKYLLIKGILNDDKCFLKLSIEQGYAILRDLGISEGNLKNVYMELIDAKNI